MVSGLPYGDGFPRTLLPVQYTVAPVSPRARAIPRPAPRVAPATTATRPASGFGDSVRLAILAGMLRAHVNPSGGARSRFLRWPRHHASCDAPYAVGYRG